MMPRLSFTVLILVGASLAQSSSGWKNGKEYRYKIKSRTLASFNEYAEQFSGIVMEGQLTIQPSGPEILRATISGAQYSPIHTHLGRGWESEIPNDKIHMQNFPLSDKPFDIKIKKGVVKDLVVDKNLPTWQVNILKSIVGQLQVDTQGENIKKSKYNELPEGKQPYATYKTMEDTVGGKCEVVYDISPLPEHMLRNKPELVPVPELGEDGEFISIVKSKNYSNCDQRVSYHFGVNGGNDWEPGSNENGKYLSRSSISHIVISGDVKQYTIQSSVTKNKVVFNSDQAIDKQGAISSKMELSLYKVDDIQDQIIPYPSEAESTGNLVYAYNNPFEEQSARQNSSHSKSPEKNENNKEHWRDNDDSYEIAIDADSEEEVDELQPEPTLTAPPYNPMLPFFVGNHGHSIKDKGKVDVAKAVKSVAREIGNDMVRYDIMPDEDTLEKFTMLSRLVRLMNAEEIGEVQVELYEQPRPKHEQGPASQEQKARRNTWAAFRDAVAHAGTGPALVNIKKWLQEGKIKDDEAAKVINSIAKSTRTPTPEYMQTFLEMLKLREVIEPPVVFDNAHQSYADLIRHAVVNKKSAHNRYPVHAFGKFYGKNIRNLHSNYFPYMGAELQDAFDRKDSIKIQVIVSAIGRTAHPRMLSLFEPYLEGTKEATPYERFFMVLSMSRLASNYPKVARSVLYKIYSNVADHYEIRTAAVYLLMRTNPPAGMLQRMADFTNHDSNRHVNSAVKSSIESLASLLPTDAENDEDLVNAARAALPSLNPEAYGPQYSRAIFHKYANPISQSGYSLEAFYIGSDDSIIPKGISITISPVQHGLKMAKIHVAGAVNKIQDLWDSLQKQLAGKDKSNVKAEQKTFSPENIAKTLGIIGDKPQLLEGFMAFSDATDSVFYAYSDGETGHSGEQLDNLLVDLPEKLRRIEKDLTRGVNFDDTSFASNELTVSFPTETGYPLSFTLKVPTMSKVIGQSEARSLELDHENQSVLPKSATLAAKVHLIHGMKVQKRLSFVAPFEHQEYIAGVDKSAQFHLPIKAEVEYNKSKREARLKVQPNNEEPQFKIVQIKVEPFTSKHDILSLRPVSNDENTRIIDKESSPPLQVKSKDSRQSIEFNWERSENHLVVADSKRSALKEAMGVAAVSEMARAVAEMHQLSNNPAGEDTEYQKYSLKISPESDMSIEMKFAYDSLVKDGSKSNDEVDSSFIDEEESRPRGRAPHLDRNMSEGERKQKLLSEASEKIDSAEAVAFDLTFKLNTSEFEASATLTTASAKSNVDEKARSLVYASAKLPNDNEAYFFSAGYEIKSPQFRTMDYEETLKANTEHELDGQIKFGRGDDRDNAAEIVYLNGKLKQSEGRKNQIRQSREAEECRREASRSGNTLTPACQEANEHAVMVDAGDFTISFEDGSAVQALSMAALDKVRTLASSGAARLVYGRQGEGAEAERNKVKFSFKVSPDEESLDFNMSSPNWHVFVPNVRIPQSTRSKYEESMGFIAAGKEQKSFESVVAPFTTCTLDKSQVKTFDNHRYRAQLGQCWHVAMTLFPKNDYFRQDQHKQIPDDKRVTVLTRDNQDGHKQLTITMGDKEIELSTYSNATDRNKPLVQAKIDGDKIKLSKNRSYRQLNNGQIVLEMFQLPDNSVKLVSEKYEIEIAYDGSRAVIQAADKYRGSVRGLCGDNDGQLENDQKTPQGCLLELPEQFAATYALIHKQQCQGPARENAEKAKQSECINENARPGNVISDKVAGRKSRHHSSSTEEIDNSSNEDASCTERRTMVSRSDSEICFSLKPLPTCASGCHATGSKHKNVDFHCVRLSATSERIAERVEKGANPDLTQKKVSKTEAHSIPTACTA